MTILDKARLRQTVYELAENDDSITNATGKSAVLEKQVAEFLKGLSGIYFDTKKNRLVWHSKKHTENLLLAEGRV